MLLEFDLAGAEWVVVAYDSGDQNMIDVVESGESPHPHTANLMTGVPKELILREQEVLKSATDPELIHTLREENLPELFGNDYFLPRNMTLRQMGKKSNHGLNYNLKYRHFALVNELPEPEAARIVDLYNTKAYPGLPKWRKGLQEQFRINRRFITNLLGRRVRLLDKAGPDLWNAVYAFRPQSTVADIIRMAIMGIYRDETELSAPMRLLAPVHDSLLIGYPSEPVDRLKNFVRLMKGYMTVPLHTNGYDFTLKVDVKGGPNWGAMKELNDDS